MKHKNHSRKMGFNHSVPEVPLNPFTAFPVSRGRWLLHLMQYVKLYHLRNGWYFQRHCLGKKTNNFLIKIDSREKYQNRFVYCEEHRMLKILFFFPPCWYSITVKKKRAIVLTVSPHNVVLESILHLLATSLNRRILWHHHWLTHRFIYTHSIFHEVPTSVM